MATFAQFETSEEYHRGANFTVWKARRRGAADDRIFAVKSCRPSEFLDEGGDAVPYLKGVGQMLEDLRKLTEKGSQNWIEVVAQGADEEHVFWVSRFFPRSLHTVLERRAQLPPEDIHWIAGGIARGLGDLERLLQRPHGNLKASNVFIDGDGRLRGLPVVLSDLKPRDELVLPQDRIADFRELGRLIVLIIRRRNADDRKPIAWPIEADVEWRRFGRQAAGWRELCNTLLNPHPAESDLDWARVAQRIQQLAPQGKLTWPLITAGVVPLVLLAGGFCYLRFTEYESLPRSLQSWAARIGNVPKDVTTVPPEWALLCQAYDNWLGQFMDTVTTPGRTAAWSQQRHLQVSVLGELLELAQNYRPVAAGGYKSLDPRNLAGVRGQLDALQKDPPEEVKKGIVNFKVVTVMKAVDKAAQALKDWPERKKLDDLRTRFTQLGWTGAAAELQGVIELTGNGTLSVVGINGMLSLAATTTQSETLWREFEQRANTLAGDADPVMRGFLAYGSADAKKAADVAALNKALADANQGALRYLSWVQGPNGQPRFDRKLFATESALRSFSGEVTPEVLTQWEAEVQEFQFVAEADDPRRKPDWTALFRKVDESLTTMRDEERGAPAELLAGGLPSQRFQKERDEARRRIDELLAPTLIRKEIALAEQNSQAAIQGIRKLEEDVLAILQQLKPDVAGWLARVRQTVLGEAGSALRREWERRRDQLIGNADAAALGRNTAEFRALREKQMRLEQFFIVAAGPLGVAAFPKFNPKGIADDLVSPLQTLGGERLNRAIDEWLRGVPADGAVPTMAADDYIAGDVTRRVLDALKADLQQAVELGTDFTTVADRLAQGDRFEDAGAAIFEKWTRHPMMVQLAATAPFRALLDAGSTLAALRTEQRQDELISKAAAPSFGIALAAWRRLGELTTWPAPADLDTDLRLTSSLLQRAEKAIRDPLRRNNILSEAAREKIRRWRVALRLAPDDTLLAQVLSRRGDFGVKDTDLTPVDRFNLELVQLKQTDWRTMAENRIVAQRDEAVARLKTSLGAQIAPPLTQWLQMLVELVLIDEQGGKKSDLRQLGPAAAGWSGELSADGRTVTFRKKFGAQEHQLGFVLIDHEKTVPFFLGTTELPTGLFLDLVGDAAVRTKMQRWLTEVAGTPEDDPRNGPQVWKLDRRRGAMINDRWTGNPQPTWPKELYPAEVKPGQPGRDVPVQYVPPDAALFLAQDILACRLPTPEEWRALAEAGVPAKAADPKGPNLRDVVWQKERDYLLAANVADLPIDADIFWPASAASQKRGRLAQPAAPERDDGLLWFGPAGTDHPERLRHLFGNVAEYLFDETARKFFVAGGSALSPPEVDPATPYPVDPRLALGGFSDVGIRLAFSAPGGLAGRSRLQMLIRNQPFVRPTTASSP